MYCSEDRLFEQPLNVPQIEDGHRVVSGDSLLGSTRKSCIKGAGPVAVPEVLTTAYLVRVLCTLGHSTIGPVFRKYLNYHLPQSDTGK